LTELTNNTAWWGYTTANAAGILNSSHVKAFLCDGLSCNNATANTKYYFGNVKDASAGGASFTTDANGFGPNDSINWANGDHFGGNINGHGGSVRPHTGRAAGSATAWNGSSNANTCSGWTSLSGSGENGTALSGNSNRWANISDSCTSLEEALICLVNP
jgi:hypothetical protein